MKAPAKVRLFIFILGLALQCGAARASVAYGTLNNFDTVNDTGVECHGFEIELEDIHSRDITYTYNWNHYGTPRIVEDNSNPLHPRVRIRYESGKNADGTWAAYTAIPSGPIAPTDGHRFTDPTVNFGGEHFGAGYSVVPANISYFWLVDDGSGGLARGPAVNVATPVFTYIPPDQNAPAQVQARVRAPKAERLKEFGPATWVKAIRTETHNKNEVKLRDLVSDDPDDPNDRNWRNGEPDEVEVEWQILQTEFRKDDGGKNAELAGAPEDLNDGDEIITRRYEFYKYVGPLDPESGEVTTENVGPDGIHGTLEYAEVVVVGDYIGSQMSAFDNEAPVGLIEHVPDAEVGIEYPARAIVIATGPFTATLSGELPDGITFDEAKGELFGTPTEAGIYSFIVRVVAANNPDQANAYTLAVAAEGEELPPHSTVNSSAFPADAGTTSGGGYCLNGQNTTVTATPAPGFAFAKWTENGEIVSRHASYTFVSVVNRAMVANFAPMPSLAFTQPDANTLILEWPTGFDAVSLQRTRDLMASEWQSVQEAVVVNGDKNRVTISPLEGVSYFRLVKP